MPHLVESMERHGHLDLDLRVRQRLLAASAATLDRLLQPIRTPAARRLRRRRQPLGRNIPGADLRRLEFAATRIPGD